jgi:hypothetical protein
MDQAATIFDWLSQAFSSILSMLLSFSLDFLRQVIAATLF